MTIGPNTTPSRRSMLGIAAGVVVTATVASSTAEAEDQSEVERLVREWWKLWNEGTLVTNSAENTAEMDRALAPIREGRDRIESRLAELPLRTFAEVGMVATIPWNLGRSPDDALDPHLTASLAGLGIDARY